MDGSAANLRPDSGLRYGRDRHVSRPACVSFRRRARAAAGRCRTARSRSAPRSPRSSDASPRGRASRSRSPVSGRRHQSSPDLADEVLPQLRRADPGAQVVGRVEARVHVGEVVLGRVADAGRLGQPLGVAAGRAAVLARSGPRTRARTGASRRSGGRGAPRGRRSPRRSRPPARRRARSARRASPARARSPRRCRSRSRSARGRARACGTCTAAPGSTPA